MEGTGVVAPGTLGGLTGKVCVVFTFVVVGDAATGAS
jgi:hypothetical protein